MNIVPHNVCAPASPRRPTSHSVVGSSAPASRVHYSTSGGGGSGRRSTTPLSARPTNRPLQQKGGNIVLTSRRSRGTGGSVRNSAHYRTSGGDGGGSTANTREAAEEGKIVTKPSAAVAAAVAAAAAAATSRRATVKSRAFADFQLDEYGNLSIPASELFQHEFFYNPASSSLPGGLSNTNTSPHHSADLTSPCQNSGGGGEPCAPGAMRSSYMGNETPFTPRASTMPPFIFSSVQAAAAMAGVSPRRHGGIGGTASGGNQSSRSRGGPQQVGGMSEGETSSSAWREGERSVSSFIRPPWEASLQSHVQQDEDKEKEMQAKQLDILLARADVVLASKQAELGALDGEAAKLMELGDTYAQRTARAKAGMRALLDPYRAREELEMLRDMAQEKRERVKTLEARRDALKRMWDQLQLLHKGNVKEDGEETECEDGEQEIVNKCVVQEVGGEEVGGDDDDDGEGSISTRSSSARSPDADAEAGTNHSISNTGGGEEKEEGDGGGKDSMADSMEDSVALMEMDSEEAAQMDGARVTTSATRQCRREQARQPSVLVDARRSCSVLSDHSRDTLVQFLDSLMAEAEALAMICIQVPSAPAASCVSRARVTRANANLNDGNNGFFSYFGGATESHLSAKPLSTFVTCASRLQRSAWRYEEELQLRARELAEDGEDEVLRKRLEDRLLEKRRNSQKKAAAAAGTPSSSPTLSVQSSQPPSPRAAAGAPGSGQTSPNKTSICKALFASPPEDGASPTRTRQVLLSRRSTTTLASRGSSCLPPPVVYLPLLHYAIPPVATVSKQLDSEQLRVQRQYETEIEALRVRRRALAARMKEAYKHHCEPLLREKLKALKAQQEYLVRQLAELGVAEVALEWEAEDNTGSEGGDDGEQVEWKGEQTDFSASRWMSSSRKALSHSKSISQHPSHISRASTRRRRRQQQHHTVVVRTLPYIEAQLQFLQQQPDVDVKESTGQHHHHPRMSLMHTRQISTRGSGRLSALPTTLASTAPSTSSARSLVTVPTTTTSSATARTFTGVLSTAEEADQNGPRQLRPVSESSPLKSVSPMMRGQLAHQQQQQQKQRQSLSTNMKEAASGDTRASLVASPGGYRCTTPRASTIATLSSSVTSRASMRLSGADAIDCAATPSSSRETLLMRVKELAAAAEAAVEHTVTCLKPQQQPSSTTLHGSGMRLSMSPSTNSSNPATASRLLGVHPSEAPGVMLDAGAVRVSLTFGGAAARRRQAAAQQQEEHQREFWSLREELARVEEDIFIMRGRMEELESTYTAQAQMHERKLQEAGKKLANSKEFIEVLSKERQEWQEIYAELQALAGGGGGVEDASA